MSDLIERIKKRIEERKWKITDDAFIPELIGMQYANYMNDWCLKIIDEELAKEPQECNSDLISRKKLIEDLFYSADGNRYPTRDCDNFPITISFEDLRKCINNQPQVQQWIPCSERLPEDLNDKNIDCFLVTDGFLIWMAYYNSEIGWQFAECTNSRNKIDWTEIVAWQPLPSVWKGEKNAEK